ncbi:MAG TPA: MEDS domain-containing protein [Nocardioidaceae bacterium]|nr:MEDS domain-containing protein [Nocardioidaceae bacterium]HSE71441.1 MEDS domain-containing protein [Nocardioidaceae bacterium]
MGGLKVLERAQGLGSGDHASWAYATPAAFHEAVTDYLADGAERGERLVYVGSARTGELADHLAGMPERDRLLDDGRLTLYPLEALYTVDEPLDPHVQVGVFHGEAAQALADGFAGLRVAGDITELAQDPALLPQLLEYELAVDAMLLANTAVGLCGFDVSRVGARWTQISALHVLQHTEVSEPMFAVNLHSDAVEVIGEVDISNTSDLEQILHAVSSVTDGPLVVRLPDLEFIDVAGTRVLARFQQGMSAAGRSVDFEDLSHAAHRTLRLFGLADGTRR